MEKQFRINFAAADKKKGVTGENLLQGLELRLDNVIYRMGLGESRNAARQLIRHNHFMVNGKRVNIPSYIVKKGDAITPNPRKLGKAPIKNALEKMKDKTLPHWLTFDLESKQGLVQSLPTREDVTIPVEEQLIVELYSR
ncbi:MAG: hypothetical protein NPINA01_20550 [Nitrospinaceae bacterium]|nr:MAG: hypothetical protein NPINA01_20550 [Nitrospinaceae bacterium]